MERGDHCRIINLVNRFFSCWSQATEDPKRLKGKDRKGKTLLMYAALGGRAEVVDYLIEQGAKRFEEDDLLAEGGSGFSSAFFQYGVTSRYAETGVVSR